MIVSMIAAMGTNRVIGKGNKMMWHLPLEFKYFKETTLGHCVITGRKNFEAMGRALPKRTNIIVTRQKDLKLEGCIVVNSIEEAIEYAESQGETEAFILGGGQIYKSALPFAHKIYLTEVDYSEIGEVYFPEVPEKDYKKRLVQEQGITENNRLAWKAFVYERIASI